MKCLKSRIDKTPQQTLITIINCAHIGSNGEEFEDVPVCIMAGDNELDVYKRATKEWGTLIQAVSDMMLYVSKNPEKFDLVYNDEWQVARYNMTLKEQQ